MYSQDQEICPCDSHKSYKECCKVYHEGKLPESALALMKSRYSAYALKIPSYIIATTHPKNSSYKKDFKSWEKEILESRISFNKLDIIDVEETTVTFMVNNSFIEKSYFEKVDGKWLYLKGVFFRKANPKEADDLVELIKQLGYIINTKEIVEHLNKLTVLAAVIETQVVGCMAFTTLDFFHERAKVFRITTLIVDQNFRNQGIGRSFIKIAEWLAKEMGCAIIELTSSTKRVDAHSFYGNLGFTDVNQKYFAKKIT